MSEKDTLQDERIRENRDDIKALSKKVGDMETEVAVVKTEVMGLRTTVDTGFQDLKDVIIARAEKDEADRARAHELALTMASDKKALWMKVLGIITTILTVAGGGGGAWYALADNDEAPAEAIEAPAPVAAPEATP
jgi:hypothetical protein